MVRTLLLLALSLPVIVTAATFQATVDRRVVSQDEHVILKLILTNSDTRLRAEGESPNIDLSPLTDDFELGIPRERHRFSLARADARSTSTLRIELFPRHPGDIIIPPFTIDGLKTEAIKLRVLTSTSDATPEIFVRHGVTEANPWVHQASTVTLAFYHRVDIKDARLDGPLDSTPTDIDLLRLPSGESDEEIDGVPYRVTTMAWAIAARHAGQIALRLPAIWVETTAGKRKRLPAGRITVTARPLPATVPASLLVGKPLLTATMVKQRTPTTAPVLNWEVTLQAPALPVQLPPELPLGKFPPALDVFAERPLDPPVSSDEKRQIVSQRIFRYTLIPRQSGAISLPEISIPYFDPVSARLAVVQLPGETITVTGMDDRHEESEISNDPETTVAQTEETFTYWRETSLALLTLWLATLIHYRRQRQPAAETTTLPTASSRPGNDCHARLLDIMGQRTCEEGLRHWEARYGQNDRRRQLVRKIQASRYHPEQAIDEAILASYLDEIIQGLPSADDAPPQASPRPWQADSFDHAASATDDNDR